MGSIATEGRVGDILISKFDDLELKKNELESYGRLEFDMGEISHPRFGTARVKGSMPLLVAKGVYNTPSLETKEKVFQYITDWFETNKLDMVDVEQVIRAAIDFVGYLVQVEKSPLYSPACISCIVYQALTLFMDDLLESTHLGSQVSMMSGKKGSIDGYDGVWKIVNDTASGKYKTLKELPDFDFPMLQPALWLAFMANVEGNKAWPDFNISLDRMLKGTHKFVTGMAHLNDHEFMEQCSNHTYSYLRDYDIGGRFVAEWGMMFNNMIFPAEIRKNLIYKRMIGAFCKHIEITNDLFGIQKEMFHVSPNNLILRRVTKENYTLQEALDQAVRELNSEMKDFFLCLDKIILMLPDEQNVTEYAHYFKYSMEGLMRSFESNPRYGLPKITPQFN